MRWEEGGPSRKIFFFSFYEVRNKRSTPVRSTLIFAGCTASIFAWLTVKKPNILVVRLKKTKILTVNPKNSEH